MSNRFQKLGVCLGSGFALLLCLMVMMAAVAVWRLSQIGAETAHIVHTDWRTARAAAELNAATRANARATMELFVRTSPQELATVRAGIEERKAAVTAALKTLQAAAATPEVRAVVAQVVAARQHYVASFTQVSQLLAAGDRAAAEAALLQQTLPAIEALQAPIVRLVELQNAGVDARGRAIEEALQLARWTLMGLCGAGLLLGSWLAVGLTRSITRPLREAVQLAEAVAAGDLTQRVAVTRRDELGALQAALMKMTESLAAIVDRVRQSSDSIATGSSQIATGNCDLSQRTEEQAANLQQTAASMEELTETLARSADNAEHALQAASRASASADVGGKAVTGMVDTMREIAHSSERIGEIVGLMDGIAFQTNLLALNAAVEAARAGDQGRGFAVVAGEVRALAQRSAGAAREVKQLIAQSNACVENGSRLVTAAGESMQRTLAQFREVDGLIASISDAGRQQAGGVAQVSGAVAVLDQVTQQNAALVEEAAAAAQSLQHQAQTLAGVVGRFKLAA